MQRDVRVHRVPAVGLAAAPLLGFLFGLGWTPCIGPTLGVILTLTANETGARGGLLLAFYSLGPRHPVRPGRPGLAAGAAHRRLGAPPPALGDRVRRRAARADRRRPAHRPVGRGGRLGADPAGQRLRGERVTAPPTTTDTFVPADAAAAVPPSRRARPPRAAALGLAPAHLDAHRARAAAAPRPGRRARLGDPAAAGRRARGHPVEGAARDAGADLRAARALRRLQRRRGSPRSTCSSSLSLVGCIVPRTLVYARAIRRPPPAAPRHLTRMPDHATYRTDADPAAVLDAARAELKRRGYRLRAGDADDAADAVSAERGYLREVGNLLFHLAVLVVLVGFALGGLFGYKGGVILVTGTPFANNPTQYDDFVPGSLFQADRMDDFRFTGRRLRRRLDHLGPAQRHGPQLQRRRPLPGGRRRGAAVRPAGQPPADHRQHRAVPHRARLRAGRHRSATATATSPGPGHQVFLPQGPDLLSFGVVKAPDAEAGRRSGSRGSSTRRFVLDLGGRPGEPVRRGDQPAAVAERVDRRPQHGHRRVAVGLRPRQVQGRGRARQERPALPGRPRASATPSSCPTGSAR